MLQAPQTTATRKELQNFGLVMAGMITLFFGLLAPWVWSMEPWPIWPWIIAGIFGLLGLMKPDSLALIFKGWMKFAYVLGWFNTRLILSIIYYLILSPIGLIFKLIKKDPMTRNYNEKLLSYRIISKQPSQNNLEKPY